MPGRGPSKYKVDGIDSSVSIKFGDMMKGVYADTSSPGCVCEAHKSEDGVRVLVTGDDEVNLFMKLSSRLWCLFVCACECMVRKTRLFAQLVSKNRITDVFCISPAGMQLWQRPPKQSAAKSSRLR